MTVIVASLFLPYTIKFDDEHEEKDRSPSTNTTTQPMEIPSAHKEVDSTPIPDILNNLMTSNPTSSQSSPTVSPSDGFFFNKNTGATTATSTSSSTSGFTGYNNTNTANSILSGTNTGGSTSRASTSPEASPPRLLSNLRKLALQPQSRAESPVSSSILEQSPGRSHVASYTRPTLSTRTSTSGKKHQPGQLLEQPQEQAKHNEMTQSERNFNETPWSVDYQHGGNGGLKNSVNRANEQNKLGDKVTWLGTLGIPTDVLNSDNKQSIESKLSSEYNCSPVYVDDTTLEGHYNHYCKQILWPTLHYQIPDDPKSKAYEDHSWGHYKRLNQAVADKIVEIYNDGDIIWINDYHLLLVAEMVRNKLPSAKIGIFLHVAFPSSEVFRCLACRKELLEGMLGANCVGFQIGEYSRHFLQTCNRLLAVDTTPFGIRAEGKFVSVVNSPIGIDPQSLQEQLTMDDVKNWRRQIRERWADQRLIVARDKLDHIRGVKQKLLAYEEFLLCNPEWIEKAVLIQVCLTSVADPELESEVTSIVDRINSLRRNLAGSLPVVLLQQDIEFSTYLALLAEADVFAVTSLREGMNLTCHEFVYCNKSIQGPLILSEFTGAASVLGKNSLLVNPWDKRQMANAFLTALQMPREERHQNYEKLYAYVTGYTGGDWAVEFVAHVESAWEEDQQRRINSMHRLDLTKFRKQYQSCNGKRVFYLNLDSSNEMANSADPGSGPGTFMKSSTNSSSSANKNPVSSILRQASPTTSYISPQRKISVLYELVSDPANVVYVISSESRATLERTFRRVSVGLIAEDGGLVRPYGSEEWIKFADQNRCHNWQATVRPMLESMSERLPGSWIQMNECSIYFHVNSALVEDPDRASVMVGECINHVNDAFGSEKIRARLQNGKVVISDETVNKLIAVKETYAHVRNAGFLFVAAEGEAAAATEEDDRLFEWANDQASSLPNVCTVAIGSSGTLAKWVIEGVNGLLNALLSGSRVRP